jgi:hypothetical protein
MEFHDSLRHGGAEHHRKLFSALSNLWSRLRDDPEAIAALARRLAPETESLPDAYSDATARLRRLDQGISNEIAETNRVCREESARLKDRKDTAIERRIEIIEERKRLEARGAPDEVIQARDRLRLAGAPADVVDNLVPLTGSEELRAALVALDEEDRALGLFLNSADPSYLPSGFDEKVKARLEFKASLKTLVTPTFHSIG